MEPKKLLEFLGVLEKLKCNTRHSWTSTGRHETVAAHSWRLCALCYLLRGEIPGIDFDKVLLMCLTHDFGEALTGDIPAFLKTGADEADETNAVDTMLAMLPENKRQELSALFAEMSALETPEARLFKALDKIEAVIQHNEAPIDTWLPLEYDLQLTYGVAEAEAFPAVGALRAQVVEDSLEKMRQEGKAGRG